MRSSLENRKGGESHLAAWTPLPTAALLDAAGMGSRVPIASDKESRLAHTASYGAIIP